MYCLLYELRNKENLWLIKESPLNEMQEHIKKMKEGKVFGMNDKYWVVESNYKYGVYLNAANVKSSLEIQDNEFVKLNLTPKNIDSKEVRRLFENSILNKLKVITI